MTIDDCQSNLVMLPKGLKVYWVTLRGCSNGKETLFCLHHHPKVVSNMTEFYMNFNLQLSPNMLHYSQLICLPRAGVRSAVYERIHICWIQSSQIFDRSTNLTNQKTLKNLPESIGNSSAAMGNQSNRFPTSAEQNGCYQLKSL